MATDVLRIPRDPTADTRTREALDIVSQWLNSLVNVGTIVSTGPGTIGLTGEVLFGSGPPAAGLGTAPCVYFDIGDPSNLKFWYKT